MKRMLMKEVVDCVDRGFQSSIVDKGIIFLLKELATVGSQPLVDFKSAIG